MEADRFAEDSPDEEQSTPLPGNAEEESPIFGHNRHEESPIFPHNARADPENLPREAPRSVNEGRKAPNVSKRQKVSWPKMNDRKWDTFDQDLDTILQSTLQGTVDRKIKAMTTIVYSLGLERFGSEEKEKQPRPQPVPNRRERERKKIRGELNSLKKQYRKASDEARKGLAQLREELRGRLKTLTMAERLRRKRKERTRKRAAFIANPIGLPRPFSVRKKAATLRVARRSQNSISEKFTLTQYGTNL